MNKSGLANCQESVLRMLKNSQTKVIFPVITYALIKEYREKGKTTFIDSEIRKLYNQAVVDIQKFLGHKFHIGGKYYDAYPVRNLPRYSVLSVDGKSFQLESDFQKHSDVLVKWIPKKIKEHIDIKLGEIPKLSDSLFRTDLSEINSKFEKFIEQYISLNPTNFEIFSFAVVKVHLEKFACKIYRDTKTSSHDKGVDLSTNFGVVYQIKKLKVLNEKTANSLYSEIKLNFDNERMTDGKVVVIIDDISKEIKNYLINMKVQSISKMEVIKLVKQFDDLEDRMKVLRIIYEEFKRDYESQIS